MPIEPSRSLASGKWTGLAGATALGLALLASGCGGPPQVAHDHRRLVLSMATAVSARNPEWLEANAKIVDDLRGQGKLSAAEDAAFSSILTKARSGDWDAAREEAYGLRDAQEPTAETSEAVQKRTLPKAKKPGRPAPRPGTPGEH
jgi:hypothetical protein